MVETIEWTPEGVVMIDQRVLPGTETYVTCKTAKEVGEAVKALVIRGAPAIGVATAMGVALGMQQAEDGDLDAAFDRIAAQLNTRPTAVNLRWALERMRRVYDSVKGAPAGEIRDSGLVAPELEIATEYLNTFSSNFMFWQIFYWYWNVDRSSEGITEDTILIDYSEETAAAGDLNALIDMIDEKMLAGQMTDTLRQNIETVVSQIPATDTRLRAAEVIYLVATSPLPLVSELRRCTRGIERDYEKN